MIFNSIFFIIGIITIFIVLFSGEQPLPEIVGVPNPELDLSKDGEYIVGASNLQCVGCGLFARKFICYTFTAHTKSISISPAVCYNCYTIYDRVYNSTAKEPESLVSLCDFCDKSEIEFSKVNKPYWVCNDHREKAQQLLNSSS